MSDAISAGVQARVTVEEQLKVVDQARKDIIYGHILVLLTLAQNGNLDDKEWCFREIHAYFHYYGFTAQWVEGAKPPHHS